MPVESVQENQEAMKPLQGDPLPPRTVSPSVTQNKEKFEQREIRIFRETQTEAGFTYLVRVWLQYDF